MQCRIDGRRAAPPRPTLLVGDLAACHAAFERLQQRVLELSLEQQVTVDSAETGRSVEAWKDLVPRCRALRETLTSLRELSHFTREVYECAADVCCRAHDYPEALKALQQLVHRIYPALAAQQQQQQQQQQQAEKVLSQQQQEEGAAGPQHMQTVRAGPPGLSLHRPATGGKAGSGGGSSRAAAAGAAAAVSRTRAAAVAGQAAVGDGKDEAPALELDDAMVVAALASPRFQRWPEAAAALALYFACVVQQGSADRLDTPATLRTLPCRLLATPQVALALRLRSALAAGDFVSLFRLHAAAPPLVRLVADAAAGRAREAALVTLSAAYRNIAAAAVCRMLQLDAGDRQLMGCLQVLAGRGHIAAQRALGGLQQEERPAAADLVFKG